ncbi:MAG: hypothetical protein IKU97_04070 [Tidjanibacter sp.]|nr:hypothetical protein [Tidjanibacter sp.]
MGTFFKDKSPNTKEVAELCGQFPWWSAAHVAASELGVPTKESHLLPTRLRSRRLPSASLLKEIRPEEFERSEMLGLIDAFIHSGDHHKIVIEESTTEDSLTTSFNSAEEDEEEFLSEDLAEIYAKQGLFEQAIEIYQKLSLQIPQKSIYFAELIEQLNAQKRLTEK